MKLVSVILDIPTQALDAPYTYRVPEQADEGDFPICVGAAVLVPLGSRQAVGFVVDEFECDPDEIPGGLDPSKLRYVKRAVSSSYFDEEGAACAQWISERYIAPLSACVRLFTPPGGVPRLVRAAGGYWRLEQPTVGEVDDRWVRLASGAADYQPRKNAVKQIQVLQALEKGEFLGLMLFVGIPLPGTGGWTGSLIAALLDVDFKKALVAEILGILIATVIMSIVSYGLLAQIV